LYNPNFITIILDVAFVTRWIPR